MIIGITGKYGSGKDTVIEYLTNKGFQAHFLSDEIKKEARRRNVKANRDNLIEVGIKLKEKYGAGILAERIQSRLTADKKHIISSLRNMQEVKVLSRHPQFVLIAVIADKQKRYEMLKNKAREDSSKKFKQFLDTKKIEESYDPDEKELKKVHQTAKIVIKNESTKEELYKKVDQVLADLNKQFYHRPSWDEYFLKLAMLASERSTCPRMHCGCVLVKDKNVLATGYNGSIPGAGHCDEIGCLVVDNHCQRTVHAEMNALIRAAKRGSSVNGATAYITNMSCTNCSKALITAGIKRVVIFSDFHDTLAVKFFTQAGVKIDKLSVPRRIIDYDLESYSSARK